LTNTLGALVYKTALGEPRQRAHMGGGGKNVKNCMGSGAFLAGDDAFAEARGLIEKGGGQNIRKSGTPSLVSLRKRAGKAGNWDLHRERDGVKSLQKEGGNWVYLNLRKFSLNNSLIVRGGLARRRSRGREAV